MQMPDHPLKPLQECNVVCSALCWGTVDKCHDHAACVQEAVLLRRERAHALLAARARVITVRVHVAFNAWCALFPDAAVIGLEDLRTFPSRCGLCCICEAPV